MPHRTVRLTAKTGWLARRRGGCRGRLGAPGLGFAMALAMAAGPALGQLTLPTVEEERVAPAAERYERCLADAETRPINTERDARAWEEEGGGRAARHCLAVALLTRGEVEEAAWRLDGLAEELADGDPELAAAISAQAAAAWEEAGEIERATTAYDRAVSLTPFDPNLLLERGAFRGRILDFDGAIADLEATIAAAPTNATAHLLVAAAYRHMGLPADGFTAIEAALALAPGDPDLLLERGNLHRVAGDPVAAAEDWQAVIEAAPESRAADAALANLDRLSATLR